MDGKLVSAPLSPDLIGIWSSRAQQRYEIILYRIFGLSTGSILIIFFIKTVSRIGLIPVAAFLLSSIIIISLEIYTNKLPHITIPLSQGVIFIVAAYNQFYNLFSQQFSFLDRPIFPLLPDLLSLILGFTILIRIIIGLEIIRYKRRYWNARTPLSGYPRESLANFEINLQLVSDDVKQEFSEELPSARIKIVFSYTLFITLFLLILLFPLWLNLLFDFVIYPYIFLIPGFLIILLSIIFFSPHVRNLESEEEEDQSGSKSNDRK